MKGLKVSLKTVVRAIKKHKTFLISTHVNPDIDGLASELAMALYLISLKKKVSIVNVDEVLSMHKFLPGARLIKKFNGHPVEYDAAIVLDCGDLNRIDKVKKLLQKNKTLINIDHHITNDYFGTINLVMPHASSTTEVIFDLFKEAKFKLTKEAAILLYAGIMTDTGSFRYDNATSRTHAITSELLKYKFSVSQLYKKIYETVPLSDLKYFTKVINNFQITHQGKVASIELSKKIDRKFSGEFDLKDKIFTFLRSIKGIEVIVILTDSEKGFTRVNFRSQGKVDVAELASLYGGGGHKKASGCRIRGNLRTAKQAVFVQLSKLLK